MSRPTLPDYPPDGPWMMTGMRMPVWLRDEVTRRATKIAVEPWVLLSHWLAFDSHIGLPPEPMPEAVKVRYGGVLDPDGILAGQRSDMVDPGHRRSSRHHGQGKTAGARGLFATTSSRSKKRRS